MSLHPDTISVLVNNQHKFTESMQKSIKTILELIENYSAMSDIGFLLYKYNVTIDSIILPKGESGWLPVRNLARILGQIADRDFDEQITGIKIETMQCGCDYFEGNLDIQLETTTISGPYKWQWTAFPERIRSYKQFIIFPALEQRILE